MVGVLRHHRIIHSRQRPLLCTQRRKSFWKSSALLQQQGTRWHEMSQFWSASSRIRRSSSEEPRGVRWDVRARRNLITHWRPIQGPKDCAPSWRLWVGLRELPA